MNLDFDTTEYVVSHGKAPRGRGGWAFIAAGANSSDTNIIWAPSSTYGEAKLWLARAIKAGVLTQPAAFSDTFIVLP